MTRSLPCMLLPVLLAACLAHAQTGPALLLSPWSPGQSVQFHQDFLALSRTATDTGLDARLHFYQTSARFRLDPTDQHGPALGFEQTYIDTAVHGPGIDQDILIQSFALGLPLGQWNGWQLGATAGLGYAGNDAWADGHAWHAQASLTASLPLDATRSLTCLLRYDGNASLWPDLPLPGFYYAHLIDPSFQYRLGLPFSGLTWKPLEKLTVDLAYLFPTTANVTVTYELPAGLAAFAAYDSRLFAYHLNTQRNNDRTFLEQDRLELGLRWSPDRRLTLTVAGGYAFNGEISRGYDLRDLHDRVDLSDEPYLRIGLDIRF